MLDLPFVKAVLDAVEPKAAELPSKDRIAIHEMLSEIVAMQVYVRSGSVVYNPTWTPRQHIVAYDSKRPRAVSGSECGAQTLKGDPCTRNAWKLSGHCWQHTDVKGREKIAAAIAKYKEPAERTRTSASVKAVLKRLDAFQATRREAA